MFDNERVFDDITRNRIKSLFVEKRTSQLKKKHPKAPAILIKKEVDREANLFISCLQTYGTSIPEFEKFAPPKQQKRKEAIKSMASALDRFISQVSKLDSAARGFVFL